MKHTNQIDDSAPFAKLFFLIYSRKPSITH